MITWEELQKEIKIYKVEFDRLYKCLNKKQQPSKETVKSHIKNIIIQYNGVVTLFHNHRRLLKVSHLEVFNDQLNALRDRLSDLFTYLSINVHIPDDSEHLIQSSEDNLDYDTSKYDNNMPQTRLELLRVASQTINTKYSGDPLTLESFINSVELVEGEVEAANTDFYLKFVISKLEGKALEAIPPNPASLNVVKVALRDKIKPDNSKVIEGRLLALRNDNMPTQDFAKLVEELGDSLKRTLIVEGMSQDKANEIAVEKTVELCRSITRSSLVKSVLASTQFTCTKTVVAKFLVETTTDVKEKQVMAYSVNRGHNRNRNNSYRGNFRGNNSYGNVYRGNNNNYRNSRYPNNSGNGYRNNSNNNSYNNNNNQNSQNRGNYRGNFNSNRGNRGNYRGNANVRYFESGNGETPQQRALGDANHSTGH